MRAFLSAVRFLYLERWSEAENISKRNRIFFFFYFLVGGHPAPYCNLEFLSLECTKEGHRMQDDPFFSV